MMIITLLIIFPFLLYIYEFFLCAADCGSDQLTDHFSLHELTYSATGASRGLDNTPTSSARANLCLVAQKMETVLFYGCYC